MNLRAVAPTKVVLNLRRVSGYKWESANGAGTLSEASLVHPHSPTSAWDIYFLGFPLIALLFFGFFRLDEVFTSRRSSSAAARRPASAIDPEGKSMRTDPDGRPWEEQVSR